MGELNSVVCVLLVLMTILNIVLASVLAWIGLKAIRMMTFFLGTSRSLAEHELRMGELKIREKEAEAKLRIADNQSKDVSMPSRFRGQPNRTVINTDPVI